MKTFHWTSLAVTGAMVMVLAYAALLMPTPSGISVAHASFPQQELTPSQPQSSSAQGNRIEVAPKVALDYDLQAVLQGRGEVPRITLVNLPTNLAEIRAVNQRKALFFKTVLPLVLQVNEHILKDRARLRTLAAGQKTGTDVKAVDRLWLAAMASRYGTRRGNIEALLKRHDVVPPSLALAQAASESGWGTSRFVREGNAMFGQWTFTNKYPGLVPSQRTEGQTHRVRAFSSLYESVMSYAINLNKHRAYREFRTLRAAMRADGQAIDGMRLAGTLSRYSQRGADYVAELRAIISTNDLVLLDGARLRRADDV